MSNLERNEIQKRGMIGNPVNRCIEPDFKSFFKFAFKISTLQVGTFLHFGQEEVKD